MTIVLNEYEANLNRYFVTCTNDNTYIVHAHTVSRILVKLEVLADIDETMILEITKTFAGADMVKQLNKSLAGAN